MSLLPSWTNSQILAQLDTSYRWYGALITYDFATSASGISGLSGETSTFRPLNVTQQAAAKLAIAIWDDLIAPTTVQVTSGDNIKFGLSTTATDYAHTYYPQNGSVWFNAIDSSLLSPQVDQYGFETFLHEVGHALGLDHMGNYNGPGNNQPSCYQDSSVYSIMSYFGPDHSAGQGQVAWADWVGADGKLYSPQTPMLSDILAIQTIYGRDPTTRAGDTIYGFHSNVTGELAQIYDFTKNAHPILTIYDAGGLDTLDLSGFGTPSTINLNSGAFSSCNSMTNNIAIAYNTFIQNAVGGGGDDVITGNYLDNVIDGGSGLNTVVCSGSVGQYSLCLGASGVLLKDGVSGRDGTDTLTNIQKLQFSNVTDTVNYQTGASNGAFASFSGTVGQYTVWIGASGVGVIDTVANRDNIQVLTNIERAQFKDFDMAFDINGSAGQAYRLYKAAFDRTPDDSGLGFWIHALDAGVALQSVANTFINSPEFQLLYGDKIDNNAFISLLYQHVLHRGPDEEGFAFWDAGLNNGVTRASVLASFSESPENHTQTAGLVAAGIQYQTWV